ncbi:phosphonatase-like hydrolase [Leucobacter coleopterorum]|uniref:Phosphonatase-like hydrolase n=1 Tax=Leucobacter coleopterorum TaxID=2714933 RepID=A0ABX6JUU1_9MICO|nr:phosphonatase-like hydrolase [Leucobacter coleopterorum]QIM18032.1 phosphonatase-like hydrolase [Leucobacter coleopterorum]
MITLAVFDMAGTTVNDGGGVYQALKQSVEETGVTVSEADLQTWMGTEKRAAITALISLGGGDPEHPADKVDATFDRFRAILSELYAATPPTPIAGAPEAIAALRADGIKVALTTGFSRDVATGVLDALGWGVETEKLDPAAVSAGSGSATSDAVTVDALVCGDEVAMGRPAPYMIHRAMELTGTLSIEEVLVAGDTLVDVTAGSNAGAKITLGVLSGKLVREDFAGQPHADLLESVAQVPDYLRNRADLHLQNTSPS